MLTPELWLIFRVWRFHWIALQKVKFKKRHIIDQLEVIYLQHLVNLFLHEFHNRWTSWSQPRIVSIDTKRELFTSFQFKDIKCVHNILTKKNYVHRTNSYITSVQILCQICNSVTVKKKRASFERSDNWCWYFPSKW